MAIDCIKSAFGICYWSSNVVFTLDEPQNFIGRKWFNAEDANSIQLIWK